MSNREVDVLPPALDCARLLYYAVLDRTIKFSGRTLLFVDGEELGAVPCLAICEDQHPPGFLLFHCTSDWRVLGCSAHESVSESRDRAERIYSGVSARWVDANVSPEAADVFLNKLFKGQRCSRCGKRPDEVNSLTQEGARWTCSECAQ